MTTATMFPAKMTLTHAHATLSIEKISYSSYNLKVSISMRCRRYLTSASNFCEAALTPLSGPQRLNKLPEMRFVFPFHPTDIN